jgi:hypothetical protein
MRLSVSLAALSIAFVSVASAQTYNEGARVETKTVTISGDVVRYEPGQVIVIRGQDGKEITYTLSPRIKVPPDVQVGQKVTLYTEHGASGSPTTVSKVVTTSITSEGKVKVQTDDTRTTASGKRTQKHTTTINGEVVKYEPGQAIVIREPSRGVVTYTLAPNASVPGDIQVGKNVTLYTEPGVDGTARTITRVTTTTSVTPEGRTKSTTEETRTDASGSTTTTTTTNISGRVDTYTAGKSITVLRSDGTRETYLITSQSSVPENVMIGKTITLVPVNPREQVVQTITIREP